MNKKTEKELRQMAIDEAPKERPGWRTIVKVMENGHLRFISTKRPSERK